jgi:glycosyltransferase involved in cell wall biosynthesis
VTPRLSVVVPFFNVEDYIHDCLDSIARQTFTDFEAILVDDGSQDGSAAIAKEFCATDARFRIVAQENQGLGPARNTGVRNASGEFLTFVDSDDLVTRHAYEKMVQTLDETGSSFVGGNARRFNNSSGVRQSWVQRIPFARNLTATHVTEFPELILDRMAWNKVYRRSFWDEFDYRFPAIRYEDYPVTLKAHLDAITVDCIAAPVYYWRERESGESITQQQFKYSNLLDRVTSAEMVIEMVDRRAPHLRTGLHAHLARIDLVALVQAFGSVPAEDRETLVQLGQRFIDRLDEDVLAAAPIYEQIQIKAVRTGDLEMLRELAQFRIDGGLHDGGRARPRPGRPWQYEFQYPGLRRRTLPRALYRVPEEELTLATTVTDTRWHGSTLAIRGTAQIRHLQTTAAARLTIDLIAGKQRIPLTVHRFETLDSLGEKSPVGFEVRLDPVILARLPASGAPAQFAVGLRSGRLQRTGRLNGQRAGSPSWAPGRWVDGHWVQPGAGAGGSYTVKRLANPYSLISAVVDGDAMVVTCKMPPGVEDPKLTLNRTLSGEDVEFDVEVQSTDKSGSTFSARIPMAPIVDGANPDDPFTQRTSRGVRIGPSGQPQLPLWTGPDQAVTTVYRGRLLILTRSPGNFVNLHESPVRTVADHVEAPGAGELVVTGPLLEPDIAQAFTWRRFFDDSDDHLDVPCALSIDDETGQWSAKVALAELIPAGTTRVSIDPLASLADWILFAVAADGSAQAVQSEAFLTCRLPLELEQSGVALTLRPKAGTLHLEVR